MLYSFQAGHVCPRHGGSICLALITTGHGYSAWGLDCASWLLSKAWGQACDHIVSEAQTPNKAKMSNVTMVQRKIKEVMALVHAARDDVHDGDDESENITMPVTMEPSSDVLDSSTGVRLGIVFACL